ncbi:MAG: SAM-dependent methyltransferase [Treponema sp.]|nr:SAM-dependent methyltransferase [Treponema sp.]
MNLDKNKPALYLIPSSIGDGGYLNEAPVLNKEIISEIRHFIVENIKTAKRFIASCGLTDIIDDCTFYELNEHTDLKGISGYLDPILKNKVSMGVISEAGCPAVADPGAAAVELAHKKGIRVVPLPGPSSMILSVMASGLNGQSFAFNGYLPAKDGEREKKLRSLEARACNENQTQLFIETPYRNLKMFASILKVCKPSTRVCIASGLLSESEFIKTKTVAEWKKSEEPPFNKVPAVFLIGR